MRYVFLIALSLIIYSSYAQTTEQKNSILNKTILVYSADPIGEHEGYLLRQVLKSDTITMIFKKMSFKTNSVEFVALTNDLANYTSLFDQYFTKYKIVCDEKEILLKINQ